jgi:hypothetical protein
MREGEVGDRGEERRDFSRHREREQVNSEENERGRVIERWAVGNKCEVTEGAEQRDGSQAVRRERQRERDGINERLNEERERRRREREK